MLSALLAAQASAGPETGMGQSSITIVREATPNTGASSFYLAGNYRSFGSEGDAEGSFNDPTGVALDADGNIYVADRLNHRIQKFDSQGDFLAAWGGEGSEPGRFSQPIGVTIDNDGNILVADTGNNRIQKFSPDGKFIVKWGEPGSDPGQFDEPRRLAVDSGGNIYVTDYENDRVQKLDSSGSFLRQWAVDTPYGIAIDASQDLVFVSEDYGSYIDVFTMLGEPVERWGGYKLEPTPGMLDSPRGIALDGAGNVLVANWGHGKIDYFDGQGRLLNRWFGRVRSRGGVTPRDIALADNGTIVVPSGFEIQLHSLIRFELGPDASTAAQSGQDREAITFDRLRHGRYQVSSNRQYGWELQQITCEGAVASNINEYLDSRAVMIDLAKGEHVTCTFTEEARGSLTVVQEAYPRDGTDFIFDLAGPAGTGKPVFLTNWGGYHTGPLSFDGFAGFDADSAGRIYAVINSDFRGAHIDVYSGQGKIDEVIPLSPAKSLSNGDVEVDEVGNIYTNIYNRNDCSVSKIDSAGNIIKRIGRCGKGDGEFNEIRDIALDRAGGIFVSDNGLNRIQHFDSAGMFLNGFGEEGKENGQFAHLREIATDRFANVYAIDTDSHWDYDVFIRYDRIQRFDPTGKFLMSIGSLDTTDGPFSGLLDIDADPIGHIVVLDGERIQFFDGMGELLFQWNDSDLPDEPMIGPGLALDLAQQLVVDGAGNVFVYAYRYDWGPFIAKFLSPVFGLDDAMPEDGDQVRKTATFEPLPAGKYVLIQREVEGWEHFDMVCSGAVESTVTINRNRRRLRLDLAPGEHINCTIINRRDNNRDIFLPITVSPG